MQALLDWYAEVWEDELAGLYEGVALPDDRVTAPRTRRRKGSVPSPVTVHGRLYRSEPRAALVAYVDAKPDAKAFFGLFDNELDWDYRWPLHAALACMAREEREWCLALARCGFDSRRVGDLMHLPSSFAAHITRGALAKLRRIYRTSSEVTA